MYEQLKNKLREPYYANFQWQVVVKKALLFGAFVALFLCYFQPFGISYLSLSNLLMIGAGFGGITFVCIIVSGAALPLLFPNFFNEEKWNVRQEVLFTVFNFTFIGLGNFIYYAYLNELTQAEWLWAFFKMQMGTLAVGAPLSVALVFYDHTRMLKKNLDKAKAVANVMPHVVPKEDAIAHSDVLLSFKSENGNVELELPIQTFLYLKTAGNYLDIYYLKKGEIQHYVLRNRLKSVLPDLQGHEQLHQCHRSYLANLDQVQSVTGNARGLTLHFEQMQKGVPVSRSKVKELEGRLTVTK